MSDLTPTTPVKTPGGYEVTGNLEDLLDAAVATLGAASLISSRGIKVMPQHQGDLYNKLNEVLNARLACLMMVALEGVDSKATGITPSFKGTDITVLCFENVLFNQSAAGAKVSALTLAELACKTLHSQPLSDEDTALPMLFMRPDNTISLDAERSNLKAGLVCWAARFTCEACPKDSLKSAT